ncbi:type I DNA topoisomerase [Candidatus Vampirococcus lugosii]|uniref:DNA topoisomerase 1 n=1 Tax=Candidatus Vampirococcus lugosii TaxID=2789015 RepID=A0ABS5QL00_9BACT|nr:DNA topoisomerase I [Candidatus Vampirococcus lugosii]
MPKSTKKNNKTTTKKTSTKTTKKKIIANSYGKNLVIVESPAKSKTIKKFLGNDYEIVASMGHIIDLPKKGIGIDIENNFETTYEVMPDKKKTVTELKKLAKNYEKVWLATDEDREGEAIAWHLLTALKLKLKDTPRIVFHEITKDALQNAIDNPRQVDIDLVNSQQARRVLDRLVGFKVSPVLWKKVKRGLSAGRVQSVAVKLVIEKENEIKSFEPEESWKIVTDFEGQEGLIAQLDKIKNKKIKLLNEKDVDKSLTNLDLKKPKESKDKKTGNKVLNYKSGIDFELINIKKTKSKKNPQAPFITSTLQQQASNKFGWGVKQVMMVAQKLYENGYITYMRTDSCNLSKQAIGACKGFIQDKYGENYVKTRQFKTKGSSAQEAHEAIRPTNIKKSPDETSLASKEKMLYQLIWIRTIASQMSEAIAENITYEFSPEKDKDQIWLSKGQTIYFDGFYRIYKDFLGSYPSNEEILPSLNKGKTLNSKLISAYQQFTKPPSRYTESSLVKKMEELGIGRPSTYAPTIGTIIDRGYVDKDEAKKLFPTEIAFVVNKFLEKQFGNLMDYKFTAKMEKDLDKVSHGEKDWKKLMKDFWTKFEKELKNADNAEAEQMIVGEKCPECGNELVYKFSKMGKFIGCSNYPDCKYIRQSEEEKSKLDSLKEKFEGKPCPEGGTIVVKIGRFGPFLASSEYPEVKWIGKIPDEKIEKLEEKYGGETCDKCGEGKMMVKKSKRGPFLACNKYPDCKNAKPLPKSNK